MSVKTPYKIVLSEETLVKLKTYKTNIAIGKSKPGKYLSDAIQNFDINDIDIYKFIELILSTKIPRIFAESDVLLDGSDWNPEEFSILGDINVVMEVLAYDNGAWDTRSTIKHDEPICVELMFTPGVLLSNFSGRNPDFNDVVNGNNLDQAKYNKVVNRRIFPLLNYANEKSDLKKALIVMPGIGCGNFAGRFAGVMEYKLNDAIMELLNLYRFPNIICVQLGLYKSEIYERPTKVNNTFYEVKGTGYPQLSHPSLYGEEFADCKLFKIVAWDHVSLPGNDFFSNNARVTDDGVSAAATNSMQVLTGITGEYRNGKYLPPPPYRDWESVVYKENVKLIATKTNVVISPKSGDGKY